MDPHIHEPLAMNNLACSFGLGIVWTASDWHGACTRGLVGTPEAAQAVRLSSSFETGNDVARRWPGEPRPGSPALLHGAGETTPSKLVACLENAGCRRKRLDLPAAARPGSIPGPAIEKAVSAVNGCRFYGVPFAVKDNIDVGKHPTTAGCPAYLRYVPESQCPGS